MLRGGVRTISSVVSFSSFGPSIANASVRGVVIAISGEGTYVRMVWFPGSTCGRENAGRSSIGEGAVVDGIKLGELVGLKFGVQTVGIVRGVRDCWKL